MKSITVLIVLLTVSFVAQAQPQLTLWISPDPYHQEHNHLDMAAYPCDSSFYIFYKKGVDSIPMAIKNKGDETLVINNISTNAITGAMFLVNRTFPIEIDSGSMYPFTVVYQFTGDYISGKNGDLSIQSNDPSGNCSLDFEVGCTPVIKAFDQDLFGIKTYGICSDAVVYNGIQGGPDAQPGVPRFVGRDSSFFYIYKSTEGTSNLVVQMVEDGMLVPQSMLAGYIPAENTYSLVVSPGSGEDSLGSVQMNSNVDIRGSANIERGLILGSDLFVSSDVRIGGELNVQGVFMESDQSLKGNVQPIRQALLKIMELKPSSYYFKNSPGAQLHAGFIAQEVEQIFPELVRSNALNNKSVNYIEIIPWLTAALQEQQLENEQLRKEIEMLKLNNDRLEKIETLLREHGIN